MPQAKPHAARRHGNQRGRRKTADPETGAGQRRHSFRHIDDDADPPAHGGEKDAVQAQRHCDQGEDREGHDPKCGQRDRDQIGHNSQHGDPVEMVNGKWARCGAGDDSGQHDAAEIERQPPPPPPGQRPSGARPAADPFIDGDQGDNRGEGHLETGAEQRGGRQRENDQGGPCDRAHGDALAVENDRHQDQADHQKRALGRDRRAGEEGIGKCADDRGDRRPFLYGIGQCDGGDQRQAAPDDDENEPGDQTDVEPGDRQQVGNPRGAERLEDRFTDDCALPGDQSGGDRTGVARNGGHHPLRDPPSQPFDGGRQLPLLQVRLDDPSAPQGETDAGKLLEIELTLQVEAAGQNGGRRGRENRSNLDPVPRCQSRLRAPETNPDPWRLLGRRQVLDPDPVQGHAHPIGKRLQQHDPPLDAGGAAIFGEHRVLETQGLPLSAQETGSDNEQSGG